jgi:hypothetical protein
MNLKKIKAVIWLIVFILLGCAYTLISPFIKIVGFVFVFLGKGKYKQYGINVWEGLDNSISSELGGDPDESLSSRLGKARNRGSRWGVVTAKVDLVFGELFGDENHCQRTIEKDEGKKQVTTY